MPEYLEDLQHMSTFETIRYLAITHSRESKYWSWSCNCTKKDENVSDKIAYFTSQVLEKILSIKYSLVVIYTQLAFTYSKSTMEIPEEWVI